MNPFFPIQVRKIVDVPDDDKQRGPGKVHIPIASKKMSSGTTQFLLAPW